jgi:hypothetical protein
MAAAHTLVPKEPDNLGQAAPLRRIELFHRLFLIINDEVFRRLVEEIYLKEGPLDDGSLRVHLLGLIQQVVNITSWSNDCNIPKRAHRSFQLIQGMFGQMGVCLLELIFREDELKPIWEVVLVDSLEAV